MRLDILRQLLLKCGADVHVRNDEALRYASMGRHTEIIKLLLKEGADIHADNDEALKLASENGHT